MHVYHVYGCGCGCAYVRACLCEYMHARVCACACVRAFMCLCTQGHAYVCAHASAPCLPCSTPLPQPAAVAEPRRHCVRRARPSFATAPSCLGSTGRRKHVRMEMLWFCKKRINLIFSQGVFYLTITEPDRHTMNCFFKKPHLVYLLLKLRSRYLYSNHKTLFSNQSTKCRQAITSCPFLPWG